MSNSPVNPWPDGCRSAVSLTFDDGAPTHLSKAIPLLEKYGFRGTFYLNPRDDWQERLAPWRAVAQAGHELGNHTVKHRCPRNLWGGPPGPNNLEGITLEDIEADILLAEERLQALAPGARTFCYPCYANYVGAGPTRQSYVPVVARHFVAGRGTGEFGRNRPDASDLHYLWSWRAETMSAAEMIGEIELTHAQGSWDIFTFHGVGGDHISVPADQFERLLKHLANNRDRIWVAPVVQVAQRLAEWRKVVGAA